MNLARRQLKAEQKRELIADQLRETPDKSLRWVAKMLGVHHTTVGSVRGEMQSTGEVSQLTRTLGADGKYRPAAKSLKAVARSSVERKARIEAVTWIHGDCQKELKKLAFHTVDAIITDPIYPEVNREYGRFSEERGGTTPYNFLPIPTGGQPRGAEHHPATTPYDVAAWWCRYVLPPGGVLLDCLCGSGTMLVAGLNHGTSQVIGIEKEKKYLQIAKRRIMKG